MKKYLLFVVISFISACSIGARPAYAQHQNQHGKIAELEKIKLIEVLNMDENTTVKFFARKQECIRKINDLNHQRDEMMDHLQRAYEKDEKNDKLYRDLVNNIQAGERDILKIRSDFIDSLPDILNYRQIAKYVVFERNFRREIKDLIMKKGMRKKD